MLEKYVNELVSKKATISPRIVYTHFHKIGVEFSYTDIGIYLRDRYNSGGMPGYTMKQYEIDKRGDRLEQIYWYKRGWFYSFYKLIGGK